MSELVSAVTGFASGALGSVVTYRFLIRPRLQTGAGTGGLATAVAEFERRLDALEFSPEAEGVTSDMRDLYLRARAAYSDATDAMPHEKYVLPALARGRDALMRLDALRNGRPVPLEMLTRTELDGFAKSTARVATDERFTWQGKKTWRQTEFLLDSPEPGRPTLVRMSNTGSLSNYINVTVLGIERTDERIREHTSATVYDKGVTYAMIPASVTHLRVAPDHKTTWTITALPRDLLPTTDSAMRGKGPMAFYHRGGAVPVVLQAQGDGGDVTFYADCDCPGVCQNDSMHRYGGSSTWSDFSHVGRAEYREKGKLPGGSGVIIVGIKGVWSFDVVDS